MELLYSALSQYVSPYSDFIITYGTACWVMTFKFDVTGWISRAHTAIIYCWASRLCLYWMSHFKRLTFEWYFLHKFFQSLDLWHRLWLILNSVLSLVHPWSKLDAATTILVAGCVATLGVICTRGSSSWNKYWILDFNTSFQSSFFLSWYYCPLSQPICYAI